jgi:hypothetical protein
MSNFSKRIEVAANLAIIVVALLLGGVLVKRYLWPGSEAAPAPRADPRIPPGSKATLPGVDWAKNGRTLLLVLSRDCRYCTESAPFYRRLASEAGGQTDIRLVAVFPQEVEEGRKYLDGLAVSVHDIMQAAPSSTGAGGTPTLILVDGSGVVKNSWVGKLAAPEESEVLNQLKGGSPGGSNSSG